MIRRFYDLTVRGIVILAALVLIECIQLVIILGLISRHVPFSTDPFNVDLFPIYQTQLQPNHQMVIYHIFIVTSIIAQAAAVYFFRRNLENAQWQRHIKQLLCVDTLWISIQCFAIFKILVYQGPPWAWGLFYVSLAASVLSRIFWVEVLHLAGQAQAWFLAGVSPAHQTIDDTGKSWDEFFWVPLLVLVESVQMVMGYNWLFGHAKPIMPIYSYGVFILSAGIGFIIVTLRRVTASKIKGFIIVETLITFLLLCALFKMVIYDYRNQLAAGSYHVLLVLAVLNKVFWPGVRRVAKMVYTFLISRHELLLLRILGDGLFVAFIVGVLYLPNPQGVLAKMFVGEQFHHMSGFIMAPAWAYFSGCVLDVDVISRYGVGLPIVLTTLTKFFGAFSYLSMLLAIMWVCIIYLVLCFVFLRVWLKSFTLAVAAILMGIKVQMFYTLTVPQPLTYASGTPVRFMFDIFFMFAIWGHLCKQRRIYLWTAALCCAAALFYMIETGLYLTTAFYAYLFMNAIVPSLRKSMFLSVRKSVEIVLCALSVFLGAFLFLWLAVGHNVIEHQFWYNNFEFSKFFTGGLGLGAFYGGLQYGQFWDLLIGFLFPLVYVLTILIVGTLCVLGRISPKHLMVVVLCIYGLGLHHYYVAMATANNYYGRGLPFVFVIFYWIHLALSNFRREVQQGIGLALVAFSSYCLWTNHHFLSYPNIFNFSRNPLVDTMVAEELPGRRPYFFHKVWDVPESSKLPLNSLGEKEEGLRRDFASDQELLDYYYKESNFPEDARLIQSLTGPHEPVALISSFETEILMQAVRKPLFYYFRILGSRPMRMRNFPNDELLTTKQLAKLTHEMQDSSSPYVFMERIFLNRPFPGQYAYDDPGLIGLLDYVNGHYRPYAYGKYLVALKRTSLPIGGQ